MSSTSRSRNGSPPGADDRGFFAAIRRYGPFFLLVTGLVGACLFSASLVFLHKDRPAAITGAWAYTPVFALPVAVILWAWKRIGFVQALLWVAVVTGAHFLAIRAALMSAGPPINPTGILVFSYAIGGAVGSILSLGGLLLLGRGLMHWRNLGAAAIGVLMLAALGAISACLVMAELGPDQLTLFMPWQIVFSGVILMVVEGGLTPASPADRSEGFLPSGIACGGAVATVVAAAALLGFTLLNPGPPGSLRKFLSLEPAAQSDQP